MTLQINNLQTFNLEEVVEQQRGDFFDNEDLPIVRSKCSVDHRAEVASLTPGQSG